MKFKVHWIIDGILDIEANSKEEAEKQIQEKLESFVKNSDELMNTFIAKGIQGHAYLPGKDEGPDDKKTD